MAHDRYGVAVQCRRSAVIELSKLHRPVAEVSGRLNSIVASEVRKSGMI